MSPSERRIQKAKDALYRLGPLLPGSISTQWNVCGKAGCRCKDPRKPKKHGPYYQLSFTVDGKSSSLFIKSDDLPAARKCVKRYQRFRKLNNALVKAFVEWARSGGVRSTREEKP